MGLVLDASHGRPPYHALLQGDLRPPPDQQITATTVAELAELVGLIEQDPDLNVVVFDSANPDFYLAHYDVENDPDRTAALGVGPTGMPAWIDLLVRMSRAPVVSIASIRGRARGAGSEFVLACDLRFASRENTLLGQFEVGIGVVPGGGRGRDGPLLLRLGPPPAQIPASGTTALGSWLGYER